MPSSICRLELDVGNSAIKWRLMDGEHRRGAGRARDIDELAVLVPEAACVWVASVADDARNQALRALFESRGAGVQFAESVPARAGVRSAYSDVARMGVDRWLAMLAAYHQCRRACVVIDAGSALTVDLVDAGGQHLGGYIIPGANMMLQALSQNTGRVRFNAVDLPSDAPGVSTEECVHHGKWLALVGSVQRVLLDAASRWPQGFSVVVAGGDGAQIAALMGDSARAWLIRPELVMDGLALALTNTMETP